MNILKFNDIILTEENAPLLTVEQIDYFNEKYKGKYTFAINWTYIVAIEDMSIEQYIDVSRNIELIHNYEYLDYSNIPEIAVDINSTSKINSVISLIASNKYTTDQDITVDDIKKFRTWLATCLLVFDQNENDQQQYNLYDDETTHMLQYYKNEMWDDVIKYLSKFTNQNFTLVSTVSTCGCNSTGSVGGTVVQTTVPTLQKSTCGCGTSYVTGNQVISNCDPINIYKKNIYLKMVNTFSNIDFWNQFTIEFITDFKRYIDNIIKLNLPLTTDKYVNAFVDCGCLTESQAEQKKNINVLDSLSKSLQFIIDNDISSHKNFIQDSLNQWSSLLYENMRW